jgi:hypothetical protein
MRFSDVKGLINFQTLYTEDLTQIELNSAQLCSSYSNYVKVKVSLIRF